MPSTTVKENAQFIRSQLKKLYAITSRQVSVRIDGSSIDITIHDPSVDCREVRNITNKLEVIRRCQVSGDILEGANRFIFIDYSQKARNTFIETNEEQLDRLAHTFRSLKVDQSQVIMGQRIARTGERTYRLSEAYSDGTDKTVNGTTQNDLIESLRNAFAFSILYLKRLP